MLPNTPNSRGDRIEFFTSDSRSTSSQQPAISYENMNEEELRKALQRTERFSRGEASRGEASKERFCTLQALSNSYDRSTEKRASPRDSLPDVKKEKLAEDFYEPGRREEPEGRSSEHGGYRHSSRDHDRYSSRSSNRDDRRFMEEHRPRDGYRHEEKPYQHQDEGRYRESYSRKDSYSANRYRDDRFRGDHSHSAEYHRREDHYDDDYRRRDRQADSRRSDSSHYRRHDNHQRSRAIDYSAYGNAIPLDQRRRAINCWDVAPPGFSLLSVEQVKATGMFPPPWGINGKPQHNGIMDPTRLAMTVLGYPLQPQKEDSEMLLKNLLYTASIGNSSPDSPFSYLLLIENLPSECDFQVSELTSLLNGHLERENLLHASDTGIRRVSFRKGAPFIFVELKMQEQLLALIKMNRLLSLGSQTLSIQRGSDFVYHLENDFVTRGASEFDAFISSGDETQFLIGNVPSHLYEDEIRSLVECFVPIKAIALPSEQSVERSGRCWALVTVPSADDLRFAIAGLNQLEIGNTRLFACTAEHAKKYPLTVPGIALSTADAVATCDVSNIIELLNIVTVDDLSFDEDRQAIVDNVRAECERWGPVVEVTAPLPSTDDDSRLWHASVFVVFASIEGAKAAAAELAGRQFDQQRTAMIAFVPVDKYYVVK